MMHEGGEPRVGQAGGEGKQYERRDLTTRDEAGIRALYSQLMDGWNKGSGEACARRDGRPETTPVWAAALGGRLYVFTGGSTGKAKRQLFSDIRERSRRRNKSN